MGLRREGKTYFRKVHLLVTQTFKGPTPAGLTVNHEDGVKANNRIDNLRFRTRSYQEIHKYSMGLSNAKGANNNASVLTQAEMDYIPTAVRAGRGRKALAEEMKVPYSTICRYARGIT